jgi:hypothetical protein
MTKLSVVLVGLGIAASAMGCASTVTPGRAGATGPEHSCDGVSGTSLALVSPSRGRTESFDETTGKQRLRVVRGVRIVLPASEGLDTASARRLTACRLRTSPAYGQAPSDLEAMTIRSRQLGDAIEVTVASDDPSVARRIVEREGHGS